MSDFDYEQQVWGRGSVKSFYFDFHGYELKWFLETVKQHWQEPVKPIRYLDIGCGGGNFLSRISQEFLRWQVVGTDLALTPLQVAKQASRAGLVQGEVENLPFKSASFDLVTVLDVLEHVPDLDKAIRQIGRILKPGGLVLAGIPLERQPWTIYWLMAELGWKGKRHYCGHLQQLDDKEVVSRFAARGFQLVNRRFGYHFLTSLVDVGYYLYQSHFGQRYYSLGSFVEDLRGWQRHLLVGVRSLTNAVGYIESNCLRWFPGGKGHFAFRKMET